MNKKFILCCAAVALLPTAMQAQSPVDAYAISQSKLRGTARFMSMAGAFTALGGDISSLTQNPAGIGVYRGSDVGVTFDINLMSSKSSDIPGATTWERTHFDINNFGYVGTANLNNSLLQTFSWGVSYNRTKSFERQFRGGDIPLNTSMSNYIALMTDGISPDKLAFDKNYNPYFDSEYNWLSILAYNGGIISPVVGSDGSGGAALENIYNGLFQYPVYDSNGNLTIRPTSGVANFLVRERGYVDDYAINLGGNLADVVQWGLGIGIVDMNFEQHTLYNENLTSANVPASADPIDGIVEGNGEFTLENLKKISGTGVNLKFGLIFKPVNEFRIGVAVHSPTWYSLTTHYNANIDFQASNGTQKGISLSDHTEDAIYDWNLHSPWRLMVGAATVLGGRGILSVDYEYKRYNDMKTSDAYGDFTDFNDCIKSDFTASNILRIGGEFRVTPQFSVRAGYAYESTNVTDDVKNNHYEVLTSGCNLGYSLNESTNYITAGLGYRIKGFYADLAYVHRNQKSTYHCFTPFTDYDGLWSLAPQATITDNSNQIVLTLGYKF